MLLGVPLTLTEDLQACAVQQDMNGSVIPGGTRLMSGKASPPPAQGRRVRPAQIQLEQAENRACESLDLT